MTDLDEELRTMLWVVNSVFSILATIAILARFTARKVRSIAFGANDWLIYVALVSNWAIYALAGRAQILGLGRHIEVLSPEKIVAFTRNLYFMQIAYVPAPPAVKLSLLFLYRRMFQYTRLLWFVYGMMVLIVVWGTINLFLVTFFCTPISALWTVNGKCLELEPYSYAVINVVTTLIVWALPIPRVWRLQIPRGQKVALSLVIALGLLWVLLTFFLFRDCSTAIGRVILMPEKNERDKPWNYAKSCMMQFIEVSTGIVCTCLPTMRISNKEAVSKGCFAFCGLRSNKTSTNDDGKFWPRRLGKIHSISSQRGGKGDKLDWVNNLTTI
ncbi:uncharacterized protein N7469_005223 [Penicillium citrinum]|uniref:Rhodopsin domain-containing protein n=1 Tax=Penicillium citrinum TaxID=5077 RepID=A0A9W9P3F7_PENCI|nr:uncharacterized protein N7469_005223 [Penicillium citrinum]KAJ5233457.1 hypothetical protein N7469_005223 [Penicillium citrinum]